MISDGKPRSKCLKLCLLFFSSLFFTFYTYFKHGDLDLTYQLLETF